MKIGLTMRYTSAPDYEEDRDAIARDWPRFLREHLPELQWLLLPNLPGEEMLEYIRQWALDGFILTGGGDTGTDRMRNYAEQAILDHAIANNKPVLGVCRGFQLIQQYLGGILTPCNPDRHLSVCHEVFFTPAAEALHPDCTQTRVNSYHKLGVKNENLAPPLQPLATTGEEVECYITEQPPLMGMLWHPERHGGDPELDSHLIRNFFCGKTLQPTTERTK
ncbi:gamma-glutamyl-gamma-aminobutyrate hydrolase family protein [Thiolapillus sp.]